MDNKKIDKVAIEQEIIPDFMTSHDLRKYRAKLNRKNINNYVRE